MNNQAINDVISVNSINSTTGGLSLQNSVGNGGGVAVRNFNTTSDMVLNCAGSTRSIFTQIAGVNQLTITSTAVTSSSPLSVNGNITISSLNGYLVSTNASSDLGIQSASGRGLNFFTNGGQTNPLYLQSSGLATFNGDIALRTTQPTNSAGYLGYNQKQLGTNVAAITTGVAYNINSTGLTIAPGVYVFNFSLVLDKVASDSGDINAVQIGISTSNTNFVLGANAALLVHGFQSYAVSGANQPVIGFGSLTFSSTATYYCLLQAAHTLGATGLIGTTDSYWQYTRVA
jgi:hypothetical protein